MPILIIEHNGSTIQLEAPSLSTGLRAGLEFHRSMSLNEEVYQSALALIEVLTIESMLNLRELIPGLRVTAHFLPLQDTKILDAK